MRVIAGLAVVCLALGPTLALAGESEAIYDGPNVLVKVTLTKEGETRVFRAVCPGNGDRARVGSGVRMPIPTTTFSTSNTVGTSMVPVVSFTYQTVGFEAEFRTRILSDGRINLDGKIEDSYLAGHYEYDTRWKNPQIGYYGHDFRQVNLKPGVPLKTTAYDGSSAPLTIEIVATIES